METAAVVKVAVSAAPYSIDKPYDYLVPEVFSEAALPGVRVMVPFGRGNRLSEGMILTQSKAPKTPKLKALSALLDREPVLDKDGLSLALWMRQRYLCTLFEAIKTILPAGLWYHFRETWHLTGDLDPLAAEAAAASVKHGPEIHAALIAAKGSAGAAELRDVCEEPAAVLKALQKTGLVWCETLAERKILDKTRRMVELAVRAEDALVLTEAKRHTSPARYEAVKLLASAGRTSCSDVCYFTGISMRTLKSMEKAGLVAFSEAEELRVPTIAAAEKPAPPIVLNDEQQAAYETILSMTKSGKASAVLLHGVTGSGKTQVYLRLVQEILSMGKTAIVLVPEIVLTPQMMQKFSAYLGDDAAMLHSALRMSERYDQWKRIRRGEVRVVLGTRSAIFAPLKNLGLIILDEEQETSYQSENAPQYHTRDIAKYLCARDGAVLLLGSATPSIETAWAPIKKRSCAAATTTILFPKC